MIDKSNDRVDSKVFHDIDVELTEHLSTNLEILMIPSIDELIYAWK